MSDEQLKALLAKLKEDAGLREKLQGAADLATIVSLAKDAGFGVDQDDLTRINSGLIQELTDSELEGMSGGTMCTSDTNGCPAWTIPFSLLTLLDGGC